MKETVADIMRIKKVQELEKFMATHEPRKYSHEILQALGRKYRELTRNRPSARMQALYALLHGQYANFHPIWNKKPKKRAEPAILRRK